MSYAVVFHTSAQSTGASTGATTASANSTGANLIVIAVSIDAGATGISVSDSKGNTWTARTNATANTPNCRTYQCAAPTVGTGHTFSVACTNGYASIVAVGASGAAAVPFDQENQAGSTSAGSVTPSEDNELIVAAIATTGDPTAIDSGFTLIEELAFVSGQAFGLGLAYKIQTTAGAVNPAWTIPGGGGVANSVKILTYKGISVTPPTSDFTTAVNQKTVTLTDASTAGTNPITGYDTDWGDSTTHGTTQDDTHTYSVGGAYTITRVVSDGTVTGSSTGDIVTTTRHVIQVIRNPGSYIASVNADVDDA